MAEVKFARELASSEPRCRRRAMKRLRRWISARLESGKGFQELEIMKLWRGLYTCMWMTDKPLVQEEVAGEVTELLHLFTDTQSGVLFFSAAIRTLCSEWLHIDRLRLDKFYMLIRKLVNECFKFLENSDWERSIVEECMSVMVGVYQEPSATGVLLHIAQVFTETLIQLSTAPPTDTAIFLFQPWAELLVDVSDSTVVSTLCDTVLKDLVTADTKDTGLSIDVMSSSLTGCASDRRCRAATRRLLYSLQTMLKQRNDS